MDFFIASGQLAYFGYDIGVVSAVELPYLGKVDIPDGFTASVVVAVLFAAVVLMAPSIDIVESDGFFFEFLAGLSYFCLFGVGESLAERVDGAGLLSNDHLSSPFVLYCSIPDARAKYYFFNIQSEHLLILNLKVRKINAIVYFYYIGGLYNKIIIKGI